MNLLIVFTIKGQMQLQVRIKARRARPPSFQLLRVCIDPVCKPGENEKIKQNSILPLLQTTVKKVFLVSSPRRVLSHPLQRVVSHGELQSARRSRTRGASQDRTEGFSVSKIRGAPQLNVPTE